MKRYVTLEEISDGKLYSANDMVKADCAGCAGCSKCCEGMGNSIILDPYDVYRLTLGLQTDFQTLLSGAVELNVVDGVILPNLKMAGEREACSFLNEEGRCSIHAYRPGICRLFPLGRYYENGGFHYILQTGECDKTRSKVKVSKWVDTPKIDKYESFVCDWHYLVNQVEELANGELNEGIELAKQLSMSLLKLFFLMPYEGERDFYEQYAERKTIFTKMLTDIKG